jgi:hypothetical protein
VTATATAHVRDVRRGSTHPGDMATVRQQQQPRTFETYAGGQHIPQRGGGGGHNTTATATAHVRDVRRGSAYPVSRGHSATATATTYVRDICRGVSAPATNDDYAAAYNERAYPQPLKGMLGERVACSHGAAVVCVCGRWGREGKGEKGGVCRG